MNAAELWLAIALGAAGFVLNMLELQLGWGMHFMFGNAIVFAFVRVLSPRSIVLAGAISSLRSVFLWHHPWAWGIWTLEAGVVACFGRKASPVRSDVLFWLLVGTPLLVLTYGMVMKMDGLSLLLVIAKQAVNGVLNVVIGEIIYLALLILKAPRAAADWPKMPIQSFVMMILLAVILIPTTVFLRIDAPAREQAARSSVDQVLQKRLQIADATLSMWAKSRSFELRMFAEKQLNVGTSPTDDLPEELSIEFNKISVFDQSGNTIWANAPNDVIARQAVAGLPAEYMKSGASPRLVTLKGTTASPQLVLIVPFAAKGGLAAIVAPLRQGALQRLLKLNDEDAVDGAFLVNSAAGILPLSQMTPNLVQKVQAMPRRLRDSALESAILVSDVSYGNALMSDLRDARMARAARISALPDWQILTITSLSPDVLKAREGQLRMFAALCSFVLFVTLLGSLLSRRTERSLRQLAQSAADLALLGTKRDKIDSLIISELNEISNKIAFAGSSVSKEHGALVNYQRRLNSIAQHAPILVYAFDVSGHQKRELVYVSETAETILGYTRTETARAGWWNRAVHPEDYDRCIFAFGNLQPGKVFNVEYRIRHRLGHYMWVYDTLSVEADPASGHTEAVGVLIDISEQKAAAEQLLQADKMASLGRMISGTAHELNQPLNFIKMAASNLREYARRGRLDADRFIAKTDSILSHVNRASAIILQMRIFGRTPKESLFPLKIKAAVDAVLTMAAPQLELDGTRVETSGNSSDVTVRALPVLLEQVLLNLILNANDAIRARRNAGDLGDGLITIGVDQQGRRAIVTIEDNGTGLAADVLPAIFEPFFTTKAPKEGTGLGLPISYGIIRDLGGTIRAENTQSGARFIIEMPSAD